jgi:dUTP pyrophosphatase
LKHSIDTGAGVIDYDYRGPVGVILFNHSDNEFVISKGDRVAQLILEKISMAEVLEVEVLSETERGTDGFGSTGVKRDLTPKVAEVVPDENDKRNKTENNV